MHIFDQYFFISILLINISPILYITHLKIYLPIILLWLANNNDERMLDLSASKVEKAIKIILIIPTVSIAVWMYYPYLFIIFLFVMVGNFALTAKKNKSWLDITTKANISTSQKSM
jgi:hypothetical protein